MAQQLSTDLPKPIRILLEPQGDSTAHDSRVSRLAGKIYGNGVASQDDVLQTFRNLQFDGENHRRLAPQILPETTRLLILMQYDSYPSTERVDLLIVGSGPHGAAVASYVRERQPGATIMMVEKSDKIGGLWSQFGSQPVFQMNSRVREANRLLPPIPRTPASINPLGRYATLELSDVAMGSYAWNTELGMVTAINGYINASFVVTGATVTSIFRDNLAARASRYYAKITTRDGLKYTVYAKCVIDATGISQHSTLRRAFQSGVTSFEYAERKGKLFNTASLYQHFGNSGNPLERFHDQRVIVVGAGDSALTVLEALLGNLPASTYGSASVSRYRPRSIVWVGAPNTTQKAIEKCLRARYKNGIVQNLPRNTDEQTLIKPTKKRGVAYKATGDQVSLFVGPDGDEMVGDILIDCTNNTQAIKQEKQESKTVWQPTYSVGPYTGELPVATRALVEQLGIPENSASLWATMPLTDIISEQVCTLLR